MRGINIFEQAAVVHAIPAINITGGKTSDVWSMKNARAANILIGVGVSAAAFTKVIVEAVDNFNGDNPVAIPFKIYKCETAADDKFGAPTDVTAAGYTPVATDNIMYGIYVDAQALASLGKSCMQLKLTNGTNSVIASAFVILTGLAYQGANTGKTNIA